jgi:hypothetical protein
VPGFHLEGSLMQQGNTVSGVMHTPSLACFPFATDIPVSGKLSGTVDLTFSLPGGQMLSASFIHTGDRLPLISGTYSVTGAGCVPATQGFTDGFTQDFTGSWHGTLTPAGGAPAQISLAFTQKGPDAHGFFSGTGTATITGGTCFSGALVDPATIIAGPDTQLSLVNSQPGATGTAALQGVFLPSVLGGSIFQGTYSSIQGVCAENGTFNLTSP